MNQLIKCAIRPSVVTSRLLIEPTFSSFSLSLQRHFGSFTRTNRCFLKFDNRTTRHGQSFRFNSSSQSAATISSSTISDTTSNASSAASSSSSSSSFEQIIQQFSDPNTNEINLEGFTVPEPPPLPEFLSELIRSGPITAADLDLTWWLPTGWVFNLLEYAHGCGLPWWATIASATLIARLTIFPLIVESQKNNLKFRKVMPNLREMQSKLREAQLSGNTMETIRLMNKHSEYLESPEMKEYVKMSKFSLLKLPLIQGLIFSSFFITLRKMSNFPIESFKDGGILWFHDLTLCDPYYALPLLTSVSLFTVLKIGVEFGTSSMNTGMLQKGLMYGLPPVIFLFTMNFSSAMALYWATSNAFSILQVSVLNTPKIRTYLQMPEIVKEETKSDHRTVRERSSDAFQSIKSGIQNFKTTNKVANMGANDFEAFKKAGIGPLKKTFKHDPTK